MTSRDSKTSDLNITKEEIDKISEALKKPEFRKLLAEYAEEISNPENRKKYEEDIAAMEREQGRDVQFIHPHPAWVVKSKDKKTDVKVFVNVASNEIIGKPVSSRAVNGSSSGLNWNIPHSLSPPRDDVDKGNNKCQVTDVVFHPDTIRMAESNKKFKEMVTSIAIEAVCKNFQLDLDKEKLKTPKNLKYKGRPTAAVVRKPVEGALNSEKESNFPSNLTKKNLIEEKMKNIVKEVKQAEKEESASKKKLITEMKEKETGKKEPKHNIIYSKNADMQDFVLDSVIVHNQHRPNQIRVAIELPGIESAGDIQLDVFERKLHLENALYLLDLPLSYPVDEANSCAKFDKKTHTLTISMPVMPELIKQADISSDKRPANIEELEIEAIEQIDLQVPSTNVTSSIKNKSPKSELIKSFPDVVRAAETNDCIEMIVDGRQIDFDSLDSTLQDDHFHLQFTSRGQGGFPIFFQMVVKGRDHFAKYAVMPQRSEDNGGRLRIVLMKSKPDIWNECEIGLEHINMKTQTLELDNSIVAPLALNPEDSSSMRIISVTTPTSPDAPCKLTSISDVIDSDDDNNFNFADVESSASPSRRSPCSTRQVTFDVGGDGDGVVENEESVFIVGQQQDTAELEAFLGLNDDSEDDSAITKLKVVCDSVSDKPSILKSSSSIENICDEASQNFSRRRKSVSFSDRVDNVPFHKAEPAAAIYRTLKNRRRRERRHSARSSPRDNVDGAASPGGHPNNKRSNRRRTLSAGSTSSTASNPSINGTSSPSSNSCDDLTLSISLSDSGPASPDANSPVAGLEKTASDSGVDLTSSPSENKNQPEFHTDSPSAKSTPKKSQAPDPSFKPETILSWRENEKPVKRGSLEFANTAMFELDASG